MKHLTSPPDLSKVPAAFVPVLDRALSKNPAQRYRAMAEMSKDVAAIGAGRALPPRPAPAVHVMPALVLPEAVPVVYPVVVPVRTTLVELSSSLILAAILAGLFCILWAGLWRQHRLTEIGGYYFLTVATCWAILIPAKLWTRRVHDSLPRRILLMCLGLLIGVGALWLDGQEMSSLFATQAQAAEVPEVFRPDPEAAPPAPVAHNVVAHNVLGKLFRRPQDNPAVAAGYLSFFGLSLFALRWWRLADRRRRTRFSLFAVLVAGFWSYLLFYVFRPGTEEPLGVLVLVMTAVIVQLVSPWQQPAPPQARRLRLRQA